MKTRFYFPVLLILLSMLVTPVFALDLQQAKEQGLVGEMSSGYLGVVKGGADVNALVGDINAKRRQEYQDIAAKNGITLEAVEKIAAKKTLSKTPRGQYIHDGSWRKK